jgi:hypothetical protein
MTIVKSWGKALGANPTKVIHNSNSDITDVHNTAAGVTSGSFLGEGWSIPPPRTNTELRPFYPAQDPYFIDYRTDIKSIIMYIKDENNVLDKDNKLTSSPIVRLYEKSHSPNWDMKKISFTQTLASWNESCTVKYDGISIGEFQVHNNRNCFKFRFNFSGLIEAKLL